MSTTTTKELLQAIRDASKLNPETRMDIRPDWVQLWTAREAEEGLQGFTFKGPGWYFYKTDTVLVLPDAVLPEAFWFHIYNGRCPATAFSAIATAPVKVDER